MSEEKKSVGETEAADLEEEVSSQAAAESGEEEEETSAAETEEEAGGSEWSPGFAKGAGGCELIFRKQTQLRLTQNSPININAGFSGFRKIFNLKHFQCLPLIAADKDKAFAFERK